MPNVKSKDLTPCHDALATNSGRSAWFVGVLVLMVYLVFAMALYLLPPRTQ
jgi:Ca2+:H+ antiporter